MEHMLGIRWVLNGYRRASAGCGRANVQHRHIMTCLFSAYHSAILHHKLHTQPVHARRTPIVHHQYSNCNVNVTPAYCGALYCL